MRWSDVRAHESMRVVRAQESMGGERGCERMSGGCERGGEGEVR